MPKASELKRGQVVEINGAPHVVKTIDVKSPSSRGANTLYKIRFNNLLSGQKLDETLKGDDSLKDADCQRVNVQYSYKDGDSLVFMNLEDYSQYTMSSQDLEEQQGYITEGMEGLIALLVDGSMVALEIPQVVTLTITETAPGIKGASASARTKPATLNTGIEVQVPEYIENGTVIKINTSTGKFMSKV